MPPIIITKDQLLKQLMDDPKSYYREILDRVSTLLLDAPIDARTMEVPLPEAVYNAYYERDGKVGVVGLKCRLIKGTGTSKIFMVDLAMETDVPDFFIIHRNVPVVAMVPAEGFDGDGRMHFAEAAHAEVIGRLCAPQEKNHLSVVKTQTKE